MGSTKASKYFADRLSDLLADAKSKGQDYKKISQATGISTGALSNYASDKQQASISSVCALADYFDVSVDYLLGRTSDPRRQPSIADDLGISDAALNMLKNLHSCEVQRNIVGALDRILTSGNLIDFMISLDTVTKLVQMELGQAKEYQCKTPVAAQLNLTPPMAKLYEEPEIKSRIKDKLNAQILDAQYFQLISTRECAYLEMELLVEHFRQYVYDATGYGDLQLLYHGDAFFPTCYSRIQLSIPNDHEREKSD